MPDRLLADIHREERDPEGVEPDTVENSSTSASGSQHTECGSSHRWCTQNDLVPQTEALHP
jgi:hypothetical protein